MILRAKVSVCTPGREWSLGLQAKRDKVFPSRAEIPDSYAVYCGHGDVQLKSPQGQLIDDYLDWEFVAYESSVDKFILAVILTDDTDPESIDVRLHKLLFPNVRISDVPAFTSVFLIASPSDTSTEGWVLMPVESDCHDRLGMHASETYLAKLLEVAQE